MKRLPNLRRVYAALVLGLAALTSACGTSDPLSLDTSVVVSGRVSSVASLSTEALLDVTSSLQGIEVSVEGSAATTTTDAEGNFRLEVEAGDEPIVLRFRRGLLDARIEIAGAAPGSIIRIEVSLDAHGGTVIDRDDHDREDFEGVAAFLSLAGSGSERTLRVTLSGEGSGSFDVEIVEGETVFEADGDVHTFAELLVALDRDDVTVRIEGDGELDADIVVATSVKVETDQHGGATDDGGSGDHDNSGPGSGDDHEDNSGPGSSH